MIGILFVSFYTKWGKTHTELYKSWNVEIQSAVAQCIDFVTNGVNGLELGIFSLKLGK